MHDSVGRDSEVRHHTAAAFVSFCGALCEVMGIMAGSPNEFSHETQMAFFSQHMGPWMTEFFDDLIKARESGFYRSVGEFGRAFIAIEKQYFAMEV